MSSFIIIINLNQLFLDQVITLYRTYDYVHGIKTFLIKYKESVEIKFFVVQTTSIA